MVLTIPANELKGSLYRNRVAEINAKLGITNSTRTSTNGGNIPLPSGLLHHISFNATLITGFTGQLKKGECFLNVTLNKLGQNVDNPTKILLINNYIYGANDPHWYGEIPVEDGDFLLLNYRNASTNLAFIIMSGLVIKI